MTVFALVFFIVLNLLRIRLHLLRSVVINSTHDVSTSE